MKNAVGLELTELYAPEIPKRPQGKSNFNFQRKKAFGERLNRLKSILPQRRIRMKQ